MIILIILIIVLLLSFSYIKNLFKNDVTILDDVKLKEEKPSNDGKGFALMLEQSNGKYEESTSSSWPSNEIYYFNNELSGCVDINGNIIENSISFDSTTNTVKIRTNRTAYCYVYFDRDKEAPEAFTFYLGGNTNPTYATSTSTTAYLSWTDTDIESYCLTTTNSSTNCTWTTTSGTSVTPSYTLTSGDGTKTVYAFLKDKAGNISTSVSDTITLDTAKPTITKFYLGGNTNPTYATSTTTTAYLSWTDTDIESYCLTTTNSSTNCTWTTTSGTSVSASYTLASGDGTKTVYAFLKDKAGNISTSVSDTITLDTAKPTITKFYLGGSSNPTYATSTSTTAYITWSVSDVSSYCLTTTNSSTNCTWTTTSGTSVSVSYTLTSGDGTKTVYAFLKDKAGNISTSVSDTIKLDTTKPTITKFYLGGSTNPTYATSTSTTAYITWSVSDVSSYCLTTTNSSTNCAWTTTSGTSVSVSYTLASGDGTKTVYAFLKDKAGNISASVSDTITLDTTKPTISSVTKTSDEQTSISVKVVASDTNGIATYYYQIGSNSVVNNTTGTYTFSSLTAGTSYTIKVYVKDKAGNTSSTTTKTFTTKSLTASEYLINNVSSSVLWDMTAEVGIDVMDVQEYRYVGTDPANYICFGTTDKTTCTSDTDKYMYRIIGIFADSSGNQHLKLIKKEALNTEYAWNLTDYVATSWNNSDLYNGINGSYFLTNTSYPYMQESTWTNKISTWNYTMTQMLSYQTNELSYSQLNMKTLYLHELNRSGNAILYGYSKNFDGKISLMYGSDYGLSLGSIALNYTYASNQFQLKTGWMHLSNNDSSTTSEWTMTADDLSPRIGNFGGDYFAEAVSDTVYSMLVTVTTSVRPVFHLASDVEISGGAGTSSNPYILT